MKKTAILLLVLFSTIMTVPAQVSLGDRVPNFQSVDQNGEKWTLKKELKESEYLVIYFYPVAFTGGCTKQACAYRDHKGELGKLNASVVGISGDKPQTLELFALENGLNFTLLSDELGEIAALFGVPVEKGGSISRTIKGKEFELERESTIMRWTFVLDKKGTLIYKDSEVNASEDSQRVIEFLSSI